jgi:hypothetical protein
VLEEKKIEVEDLLIGKEEESFPTSSRMTMIRRIITANIIDTVEPSIGGSASSPDNILDRLDG